MGTEPNSESGYIFGSEVGFGMNGMVYIRMYVKAWQRWAQSRIRSQKFGG